MDVVGLPRASLTKHGADRREQRRQQAAGNRTLHVIETVSRLSSPLRSVDLPISASLRKGGQLKHRRWTESGLSLCDRQTMGFASILFGGSFGLGAQLFANAIQKVPLSRSTYTFLLVVRGPIDAHVERIKPQWML
jgi:hypothetical protein